MTTPAFRIRILNVYAGEFWTEQGVPLEFPTIPAAVAYRDAEVARLKAQGFDLHDDEARVIGSLT